MERTFKCNHCALIQFGNEICTLDGSKMGLFNIANLSKFDRLFNWHNESFSIKPRYKFNPNNPHLERIHIDHEVNDSILKTVQETLNELIENVEQYLSDEDHIITENIDLNESHVQSMVSTSVNVQDIIQGSKTSFDLNQLYPMNDDENADSEDLIEVIFSVVVPKQCIETNKIKICFLMDKSYNRLDFKTNQETREFNESDSHSLILTAAQFPSKILNSNYSILYFYYFIGHDNSTIIENLLLELKQLRHLGLKNDKRKTYLKYDGFALFKQIEYRSNQNEIKRLKEKIVQSNVHIEALRHESIKEIHSDFIDKLVTFYDSLCRDDEQYHQIFEQCLDREFKRLSKSKLLDHFSEKADWEYLIILTMFFCVFKFHLTKYSADKSWLNSIFRNYGTSSVLQMSQIKPYFGNQLSNLSKVLERFLELNNQKFQLSNGIHALNILYFINKNQQENTAQPTNKLKNIRTVHFNQDLSKYTRYVFPNKKISDMELIFKTLNQHIQSDAYFGALCINYFACLNEKNLDVIFSKIASLELYFNYLNMIVCDKNKVKEKKFIDHSTKKIFTKICMFLNETARNDLKYIEKNNNEISRIDTNQISQIFNKVNSLLKNTINLMNNDFEVVTNVIQLFLTYFQSKELSLATKTSSKRHEQANELKDRYEQMIGLISECLKQKCNKSIITNYGLDMSYVDRSDSKWHQNMLDEVKRRQFTKYEPNNRKKIMNDKSIHFFENERIDLDGEDDIAYEDIRPQRSMHKTIKNIVNNFGSFMYNKQNEQVQEFENNEPNISIETNEEGYLFALLFNVQMPMNSRYSRSDIDSFESQMINILNKRLKHSSFYELIIVRSQFNFESIKYIKKGLLIDQFDKKILEQLISNEETNIEILCRCLDKNEKLLQFYMNNLLKEKNLKDNRKLEFMLSSKTYILIYEQNLVAKKKNRAQPLDKHLELKFSLYLEFFTSTLENIAKGDETLANIRLFNEYFDNFMKLVELLQKENPQDSSLIKKRDINFFKNLFLFRIKEVDTFESYKVSIKAFLQFCSHFKQINMKSYERQLELLAPIKEDELKLSKICNCVPIQNMHKFQTLELYQPDITSFGDIKFKEIKIINEIISLDRLKCILFDYYFAETCNEMLKSKQLKELTVQITLTTIYPMTLIKWKVIADIVENGSIKLMKIDELLAKFFSNNFAKLYEEFNYICSMNRIKNLKEQMDRVDRYNRFRSSVDLAKSIEEIRKSLKMTKNFNEIKDLLNIKSDEFKEWTINKMDAKVESTIQILSKMSSTERHDNEKLRCLKAFVDSVDLVEWLRSNIKDIKELKYFVEIVSTTKPSDIQNQNSNRALLPKTLKEAGIAFAPLIFDLKIEDGFEKFMSLCQTVWSHLENDKKISQKLIALKDEIPVLESIRVKKSNVELSAINQAKQFNEKGIYRIGYSNSSFYSKDKDGVRLEDLKCISKMIELEIELEVDANEATPAKHKSKKKLVKKTYTLERLKELQNLLMLVSKKSKTSDKPNQLDEDDDDESSAMEYFIEIFNNVVRLAEIYLKLIQNGCVFFESFMIKIFCDYNDKLHNIGSPTLTMQSNSEYTKAQLKEQLINIENNNDSTINALKNSCIFMENCLDIWLDHLYAIRNEYNHINYYTIKQIIFLRYNLSKLLFINQTEQVEQNDSEMALSLLSTISPDLTIDKLKQSHTLTLEKYKESKSNKLNMSDVFDEKINKDIVKIATDNNFNLAVVKKAFQIFGSSNHDQIIDYCIENDTLDTYDQEDDDDELTTTTTTKTMDIESNIMNMSIEQKYNDYNVSMTDEYDSEYEEFCKKIDSIWKDFMKHQNKISANILSIEHLAILLETIDEYVPTVKFARRVPGYLTHKGHPNLIICPAREQIPIVLSIYAFSTNEPLPSNDECLFCSSETTSEEVENFFRIAFKSDSTKIYTIMNIQELNYKNSALVEKFLSSTRINQTNNYVLACICSAEKLSQSILASSLIKYRIQPIMLPSNVIEEYLSSKLRIDQFVKDRNYLPYYDHNKSCVRALLSEKPGNGKSTYVKHFRETVLKNVNFNYKVIRIKSTDLNIDNEVDKFFKMKHESQNRSHLPTLFHIDIAFEVFQNVDLFLFNLIINSCLKHSNGYIWRRAETDFYFIEMMPPYLSPNSKNINSHYGNNRLISFHSLLNYLPKIQFRTPKKYLFDLLTIDRNKQSIYKDNLFEGFFNRIQFQRTALYLKVKKESPNDLATFTYNERGSFRLETELNQIECLTILLEYSELKHPNWTELNNFVNFLDEHLDVLENASLIKELPELRSITAQFIILMAHDFGLPSLNIGEESNSININDDNQIQISIHSLEIARRWDLIFHPYIIFNSDRETFTFMGIYLDRRKYKFINPNNNEILEDNEYKIKPQLRIELLKQRVPLYDNFNEFPRTKKINQLRAVMGLNYADQINQDPDPTYELTLDNCLKLMAIYMRLRCNSPVIVMGETGCGKTRILKFFSDLHLRNKLNNLKHLLHVKIHGGTTAEEIEKKVEYAERMARVNKTKLIDSRSDKNGRNTEIPATAVLFFDEANTTEAIGLIKEIMCDLTCNGRPIDLKNGLKIVAAVNPYRKHSDEMIEKLEEAGLGFYMSASDTKEKLGHIPMRQLVYRVQPLPASMVPLVWDFGQLDANTENVYITQMLKKALKTGVLTRIDSVEELEVISKLLTQSQSFMRKQNDECSFVSLRDIERVIKVSSWFLNNENLIFTEERSKQLDYIDFAYQAYLTPIRRSFLLALSVCYHSCLNNKETRFKYRNLIASIIPIDNYEFSDTYDWVLYEILNCQHTFLDQVSFLQKNIARNSALLENVFMIIICIELRIPLFIVGKPGSSKSLAKSIVANSMEGQNSKTELFRNLKETYFVNFQCSPLTTPEMIVESFKEAANMQQNCNLEKTVAVVNLDEIGLAEGSESMPLKALHPLLEEGTDSEEPASPHQKVAVIGISNWALDPAKMNRGIFVSRGEPDIDELVESAKGICKYDEHIFNCIEPHIREIAEAYLEICKIARNFKREFFGLRDYYSLIKMLYWFCSKDGNFTWYKLEHSVKRNFSGLDIDPILPFKNRLFSKLDSRYSATDPLSSPIDLIKAALKGENVESNSRYLLLISENYSLIDMIQKYILNILKVPSHKLVVIFGSSFRHDQEYTEVVRNISRIKHCMEIGNTVILLNFFNLYESLYDALNQYYHEYAGQRYVYLGLGTHRVNCSVHENFRLIVIADKESVYDSKRFPIPLINRLEKHFLNASSLLNKDQIIIQAQIEAWVNNFCLPKVATDYKPKKNEVFIGLNDDTIPTLILSLAEEDFSLSKEINAMDTDVNDQSYLIKDIKKILLKCATADSVIRQSVSNRSDENHWEEYFDIQKHSSFKDLIENHFNLNKVQVEHKQNNFNKSLLQITTNSKNFMSKSDLVKLTGKLNVDHENFSSCLLQSFDTQQQFKSKVKSFIANSAADKHANSILIIQTDFSKKNSSDLISCARHSIVDEISEAVKADSSILENCYIILVINLTRENLKNFVGFQVGYWSCYHIDELDESNNYLPSFNLLRGKQLSVLLKEGLENLKKSQMDSAINETSTTIDLKLLLKKLAHQSCSLIIDTNITRTIHRIELFIKLCDNDEFLESLTTRLVKLQAEKECDYMTLERAKNWLTRDAADLKNVNQYSTLKRSCHNYFESRLSPLIAYILSFIDLYSNLDLFADSLDNKTDTDNWKLKLWLNVLNDSDICKIEYADMRKNGEQDEELKQFYCKSDWLVKKFNDKTAFEKALKPSLPFFWILINNLNLFYKTFIESRFTMKANLISTSRYDVTSTEQLNIIKGKEALSLEFNEYVVTVPNLFESTEIYKIIYEIFERYNLDKLSKESFLDYYINDFILINCELKSHQDLTFIKNAIKTLFTKLDVDPNNLKLSLPLVHFEFEKISMNINDYLKFSSFEPSLNDDLRNLTSYSDIDFDSCVICIQKFEKKIQKDDPNSSKNELCVLLHLVKNTLTKGKERSEKNPKLQHKYEYIQKKHDFLRIFYLFLDNVMLNEAVENSEAITATLSHLATLLKVKYSKEFEKAYDKSTLEHLHEFLIKCVTKVKALLTELNDMEYFEFFTDDLSKFYLNVVELIFFSDNKHPNDRAVEAILRIITEAKIVATDSVSSGGSILSIKSSNRSILLQLVFRNYGQLVEKNLTLWFNKCSLIGSGQIFDSSKELAIFFQNCVYDKYFNFLSAKSELNQIEFALAICQEIIDSKSSFVLILTDRNNCYNVQNLINLGRLKFCLEILSYLCIRHENMTGKTLHSFEAFNDKMKKIVESTGAVTDTIFNFLIKLIIRKHGSASIKQVIANEHLKWITPQNIIGDDLKISDRYLLIGEKYVRFKKAISTCFQDNNANALEEILSDIPNSFHYLCLALYQNITLLYKDMKNMPVEIFVPTLSKYYPQSRQHWEPLIMNSLTHNLNINNDTWKTVELNLLLVQIKFSFLFTKSKLIKPIVELINNPLQMKDCFLPTMPQDILFDLQRAITTGTRTESPKFYACPNGHPYVLFDCGRPWVLLKCSQCGENIGGTNHKLLDTNKELNVQDNTAKGYCLPDSKSLSDEPINERLLNSTSFHIIRFFIHASMYLSCEKNEKEVHNIMTTNPDNKKEFFWNHIKKDLNIACKSLNVNFDEMLILLHVITNEIMKSHNASQFDKWKTKEERQAWENAFAETYLSNILKKPNETISTAAKSLKDHDTDQTQSKKLYFMAYELLNEDKELDKYLNQNLSFWKYKPKVDFIMMSNELKNTTKPEEFLILKKFIELSSKLKMVSNLAPIIKFVNFLQSCYFKTLFKYYATNHSMREILISKQLTNGLSKDELEAAIQFIQSVWSKVKQFLPNYVRENISVEHSLLLNFEFEFNLDSKLSCFLPTLYGDGLILYSIIHFLSSSHNDMLSFYYSKRSINHEIVDVKLFENNEYIVQFDENDDLLRIIQSNFTYDSKNSKCIFRYENITNQLIDRYFQTKPLINIKQIPIFEYADEINDSALFYKLNETIIQSTLDLATQAEIFNEFKTINEVSEGLNVLKIVINYAKATSAGADEKVSMFMKKIYVENSMKNFEMILKLNISEKCQLKHLKHVCIILMMKKSFFYSLSNQDPFENLNSTFKAKNNEINLLLAFDSILITSLSLVIYQLILYLVSLNNETVETVADTKMRDMFYSLDSLNILIPENLDKLIESIPKEIEMKFIYSIWNILAELIQKFSTIN